jgi:hypothetical protein
MSFATFATARDALYVSALFLGLAIGFTLRIFKTREHKSVLITATLYLFSLGVFAATVVIVLSQGAVLYDCGLVLTAFCIAGFTAFCVFFPVTAAFPAILIAGVVTVWAGAVFWRFPREPDPEKTAQTAIRCGDLVPVIGGEIRYLDREPAHSLFFHEEFAILSPAKNRLVFSFVSNRESLSSAGRNEGVGGVE